MRTVGADSQPNRERMNVSDRYSVSMSNSIDARSMRPARSDPRSLSTSGGRTEASNGDWFRGFGGFDQRALAA